MARRSQEHALQSATTITSTYTNFLAGLFCRQMLRLDRIMEIPELGALVDPVGLGRGEGLGFRPSPSVDAA